MRCDDDRKKSRERDLVFSEHFLSLPKRVVHLTRERSFFVKFWIHFFLCGCRTGIQTTVVCYEIVARFRCYAMRHQKTNETGTLEPHNNAAIVWEKVNAISIGIVNVNADGMK